MSNVKVLPRPRRCHIRGVLPPAVACLALVAPLLAAGRACAQAGGVPYTQSVPGPTYFAVFPVFYDGQYREALKLFQDEARGGIKSVTSRWIDSICYHTMAGECFYNMGQLQQALDQYTRALQLELAFADWMIRVQFPVGIQAENPGSVRPVPWGRSTRQARIGHYPETMPIGQGRVNNNAQIRNGGVVQAPILYPIHVQEIVRCTTLAMRRRMELMGPACVHDPLTADLITALARRPGPPNHWSEVWIDVQLGLAYAAGGKDVQARTALERSLLAQGEYDHPLTGVALLELGKMALAGGDFNSAGNYFAEASYAAAAFYDAGVVEEAFRYGQLAHLVANRPGVYPPLAAAVTWARANEYRQLQAAALILAAENYCVLGQAKTAANLLADARGVVARRNMATGKIGARLNFITALANYQQGAVPAGDQAYGAALAFQRNGSLWLFQIDLTDRSYTSGDISPRVAMELYGQVLRDPTPADWATDPLESLSKLAVPHPLALEHWFEVAIDRKEHERALEISDLARRHRFLTTLDFGGRVHNLRWLLEGPEELLDQQARLERQDLLARYGKYEQLRRQADQLQTNLKQAGLVADNPQALRAQNEGLARLAEISVAQEVILREIAVRREPGQIVFPPVRSTKEVQAALPEGHALLSFFATSKQAYAFLMTRDKYGYWKLPAGDAVAKAVTKLLQGLGNYEQNREITLAELQSDAWRDPARQIMDLLMKDSRADLAQGYQQLVVVPDGVLWYVPFEVLQVRDGEGSVSLADKLQIRYAPLVSLGVADPRGRRPSGNCAVVLGKMVHGGDDAPATAAFDELSRSVPGAVALRPPFPADAATYASLFSGLIVLNDVPSPEGNPYNWAPIPLDRNATSGTLATWFALPWGGPDFVILPSFHTPAERAMKKHAGDIPGQELFLSTCGLMANGVQTILMSRWRTGGQTSIELVREFAQELPHASAAEAWRRSVTLVTENQLDPEFEPRLRLQARDEPPKADHPFFWAGYLLVDSGSLPADAADQQPKQPPPEAAAAAPPKPPAAAPRPAGASAPAAAGDAAGGFGASSGDNNRPDLDPPEKPLGKKPKAARAKPAPKSAKPVGGPTGGA